MRGLGWLSGTIELMYAFIIVLIGEIIGWFVVERGVDDELNCDEGYDDNEDLVTPLHRNYELSTVRGFAASFYQCHAEERYIIKQAKF